MLWCNNNTAEMKRIEYGNYVDHGDLRCDWRIGLYIR